MDLDHLKALLVPIQLQLFGVWISTLGNGELKKQEEYEVV